MSDSVYKLKDSIYAKRKERSAKWSVWRIPISRKTAQTAEKQGRYSMEKAVKETRAGNSNRENNSFFVNISKMNIRFSLAKNPAKSAVVKGGLAKPSGEKIQEKRFLSFAMKNCGNIQSSKWIPTEQRKNTVTVRFRNSLLLFFASLKSTRRFGIL